MFAEYLVTLCLVSLGAALAIGALGIQLVDLMLFQQAILLSPLP